MAQYREIPYVDADGDADPWWGSRCIRERQQYLSKVDGWDYDSMAVSNFGLLWDPALLSRVRKELQEAALDPESLASPQFFHKLIQIPLLQSIYAEVIRLHVEVQHVLYSHHSPADRFLLYPENAMSGPIITTPSFNGISQFMSSSHQKNSSKPIYYKSIMQNSFIKYNVEKRTYPKRFLAKREIIAVFARIVQQYDVELLTEEKHFKHRMAFYAYGTQAPKNKIPFTIKRRER
ncbi:hypothetical protein BPOR_1358g00010 [Botrytis porri]|uniref:Uncharacterized protein n=1 Tax=Botrytis porri TaxID=87229 RepID=A0A4Z1K4P0_9HELO|nr:hypothetical protein BPOR_1358g00010 [Botrytis porri]